MKCRRSHFRLRGKDAADKTHHADLSLQISRAAAAAAAADRRTLTDADGGIGLKENRTIT